MIEKGAAKKVTIYVNEDARSHHGPLYEAVMRFLLEKGVAGATATRCLEGFGSHHQLHTPKIEVLAEHLPIRIEFIESAERVDALLPDLYELVTDGLIDVQETTVIKSSRRAEPEAAPRLPRERSQGAAKMMRIFLGEADRFEDEPLYDAIVKRLRMMDIVGATVYRGILGYGAKGHTHREHFLHISKDLPVMITVVDMPDKISRAADAIETMMEEGLIVFSDVEYVRLVRPKQIPPGV
jgi:PII-like signaling protein